MKITKNLLPFLCEQFSGLILREIKTKNHPLPHPANNPLKLDFLQVMCFLIPYSSQSFWSFHSAHDQHSKRPSPTHVTWGFPHVSCQAFVFWLNQWTIEKISLPYSLLLDYSTFEFTTLPYPTRSWKTTTRQGLFSWFVSCIFLCSVRFTGLLLGSFCLLFWSWCGAGVNISSVWGFVYFTCLKNSGSVLWLFSTDMMLSCRGAGVAPFFARFEAWRRSLLLISLLMGLVC